MLTFILIWLAVSVGFIGGFLFVKSAPLVEPLHQHGYMTITLDRSEYRRVK